MSVNNRIPETPTKFHTFKQHIYSSHENHEKKLKQHSVSLECICWKLFCFKVKFQGGCSQ